MATLILNRPKEFLNRMRNYGVFIDGEKVGTIANGQTEHFFVPSGQHTIFAKIDWCRSLALTFEVTEDEKRVFRVNSFKHGNLLTLIGLGFIILSIIIPLRFDSNYFTLLAIPSFALLVYYTTLGHDRYLNILEQDSNLN